MDSLRFVCVVWDIHCSVVENFRHYTAHDILKKNFLLVFSGRFYIKKNSVAYLIFKVVALLLYCARCCSLAFVFFSLAFWKATLSDFIRKLTKSADDIISIVELHRENYEWVCWDLYHIIKRMGFSVWKSGWMYDMQNMHRLTYPPSLRVDYPPILFLAS